MSLGGRWLRRPEQKTLALNLDTISQFKPVTLVSMDTCATLPVHGQTLTSMVNNASDYVKSGQHF
jgi:hypothetical protein